jgi:hypothetical protein
MKWRTNLVRKNFHSRGLTARGSASARPSESRVPSTPFLRSHLQSHDPIRLLQRVVTFPSSPRDTAARTSSALPVTPPPTLLSSLLYPRRRRAIFLCLFFCCRHPTRPRWPRRYAWPEEQNRQPLLEGPNPEAGSGAGGADARYQGWANGSADGSRGIRGRRQAERPQAAALPHPRCPVAPP